ncbi:unnamed protein product [Schistosoma turkestanicum]|nr:unnamed protein product [Schistosoma turkestanicum]
MNGVSKKNYKGNQKGNAHIQKRLYTSLGSFHDFIVDTGSIESIISFKNLKSLDPNVVIRPTDVSILGITGHKLPIRGCCELLIRDDNSSYIPCEFLVSETGLSILGLKNLRRLKVELSFLVSKENSDALLKDLIATCAKCNGSMKMVQHGSAKQIQHVDYISRQSLNADICRTAKNCEKCHKLKNQHSRLSDSIAASTFNELERGVDTFLLQYRNARHSVTKETPSKLLKGRILRSNMRCLESAEVTYYRGNDLRPSTGIVQKNVGKSMVRLLDINDLSTHNRHVDQIQFQEPGESVPISVVNSNTNESILDNTEPLSNTLSDRHRMNLRRRCTTDYRHIHSNLSGGGCGV